MRLLITSLSVEIMKQVFYILLLIAVGIICFIWGKHRTEPRETIRYVQGETVSGSIEVPPPYRVEIPNVEDIVLPMRADTVWKTNTIPKVDTVWLDRIKTITQVVDTARIIADFVAINHYAMQVFDIDTVGTLNIRQSIQYNRLRTFEYDFTPMIREITFTRQPRWAVTAGVGVGYSPAGFTPHVGITFGRTLITF